MTLVRESSKPGNYLPYSSKLCGTERFRETVLLCINQPTVVFCQNGLASGDIYYCSYK